MDFSYIPINYILIFKKFYNKKYIFFFKFFATVIILKFIFQRLFRISPVENKVSQTQNSCQLLIVL